MNRQHRTIQTGFTLIEFMIASILGLIVIAAVGSLYIYTAKLNEIAVQRVNVQQDLRNASTIISRDARVAGNFGCLNIGSVYDQDSYSGMGSSFHVQYSDRAKTNLNTKTELPISIPIDRPGGGTSNIAKRSFGVRVVEENDFKPTGFTPSGKAVLFYYGLGSSASTSPISNTNLAGQQPVFRDSDPNQTIYNTAKDGGYLAVSSCSGLYVFSAAGVDKNSLNANNIKINTFGNKDGQTATLDVNDQKTPNSYQANTISLFRYMITAYAVGTVDGKTALYRFELGEDGKWQGPELLADNVSKMDVNFVYTSPNDLNSPNFGGCPTGFGDSVILNSVFNKNVNNYDLVKDAKDFYKLANGDLVSPSAVELNLTYTYPTVNNEAIGTEGDQTYHIYAAIRGGNACANRILSN